jgi:ParB family chromosome partitioning protein
MAYESDSIFWVEVEKIVPNPYQPRREFHEAKLRELGESIRMYGMLQPLTVTRREIMEENGSFRTEYELIAGERRLRAAKLMGLGQVPVIIRSDEESEMMKLELAIIENLQREDLNPVDRARAFKQLADQFGLSHSQIAKKMGRSREYVSNSVRLLQLPETILSALQAGDISDGHARTLLMLNDRPEEQDVLFREILLKKLSVREVERQARKIAVDKVRKKNWDVDPELMIIERKLTDSLGTRVQISKTDYGGKLVIDYFSDEDLTKLVELMNRDGGIQRTPAVESKEQYEIASDDDFEEPNEYEPMHTDIHDHPVAEETPHIEPHTEMVTPEGAAEPSVDDTHTPVAPIEGSQNEESNTEETKEKDDDELYSIKNFSL